MTPQVKERNPGARKWGGGGGGGGHDKVNLTLDMDVTVSSNPDIVRGSHPPTPPKQFLGNKGGWKAPLR